MKRSDQHTFDQRAMGDDAVVAAEQRRSMAADRLAGGDAELVEKSCRATMLKQWPTMASLTSPVTK